MNDKNFNDRFDRDFNRFTAVFVIAWILAVILALGLLGLAAWAVIEVVGWLVTK